MGNTNQNYKPSERRQIICKLSQLSQKDINVRSSQDLQITKEKIKKCEQTQVGSFKIIQKNIFSMKRMYIQQEKPSLEDQLWLDLDQKYYKEELQMKRNQIVRFNNLAIKVKAIIGIKQFQRLEYLKQKNRLQDGEFPKDGLKYIVKKAIKKPKIEKSQMKSWTSISTQGSFSSQCQNYNKICRICLDQIEEEAQLMNCNCLISNPVHLKCFQQYEQKNFIPNKYDNVIQYPLFTLKCDICQQQLQTCYQLDDEIYPFINPQIGVRMDYAVLEVHDLNREDSLRSIILIDTRKNYNINFTYTKKSKSIILEKENYSGDDFIMKIKNKKIYLKLPNYGCAQINVQKLKLKPQKQYNLIQNNTYFVAQMSEQKEISN